MFENSWSIKLSEAPQYAAVAYLSEPAIVYQGKSNQLSVYCNNQTHNLPIRKQIIALSAIGNEHVLILTKYNLSCFDFLSNEQKFSRQFECAQKLFVINNKIYVTSGASLHCYDANGEQQYVNHVSAAITSITNVTNQLNPQNEDIIIATSDMAMMRYNKLNIVFDYAKIIGIATSLCWIGKGVMVGTEEGPIAFYESKKYKWKAKSIHAVSKILKFQEASDFNQNKEFLIKTQDKIVVIRVDGNIELRDWENGGTLAKIKTGEIVINSFVTDFRKEGTNQIVCILESGTVKAFNLKDQISGGSQQQSKTQTVSEAIQKGDELERLNKIKQQLRFNISELKNALAEKGDVQNESSDNRQILAPDFKLTANLEYSQGLILQVNVTNGYISGLTFEQPLMPVFVEKAQNLKYKFLDSTQSGGELNCEVLVHSSISSTKFEIKRLPINLPKFWKWGLDPETSSQKIGRLKFKLIQRNSRYLLWLKECFLMNLSPKDEERMEGLPEMKFKFSNWYDKKSMEIIFSQKNGTVFILCNCLKTMGEIFQDLINYVGLKHLNSELEFPQEKQKIKQHLEVVERLSQTKVSLTTDLADSINSIKFLLVKGESARIVGAMSSFRKTYGQIMEHNRNLITEIEKKNMNTKILTQTLKSVNTFINQIANVRYGEPKNKVIAKCRQAIKTKRFPQIFSVMDKGAEYEE